ncbi:hypothetical protein ACTFIY_006462 [Dictyostelium cf. discoideum]
MVKNLLIFIFIFLFLNSSLFVKALPKNEHDALVSLLTNTGLLGLYKINSTLGQYDFCSESRNITAVDIKCAENYVIKINMECSLQNQIKASDFVNNFFKLYFDEVFFLTFSKCTMEPGFLGKFPQKAKERIYRVTLDSCENSIESVTGVMPIKYINLYFNKEISTTIDLGYLRGSFEMSNSNNVKFSHSIYYTNSLDTYSSQTTTLTIFASNYPPLGPFLDVGFFKLILMENYDRSSISNVLNYDSVDFFNVNEDSSIKSLSLIPPIDKIVDKSIIQTFYFVGNFYTDRLLDYSGFTKLFGMGILIENNNRNFTAPGNKFPLSGLPKNLVTPYPTTYFQMSGFGGVFSSTSDYSVFKNSASIFNFKSTKNGISGPLPSWDTTIKSVTTLDFSYNNLTGTIDYSFCSVQNFKFDYNSLSGEIPSCIKCYMQSTPGSITIIGNRFTNNNNNETCKSIIPSYLLVNSSGSYLYGKDLGFNASYITSVPAAKWVVNTPSSILYTSFKFPVNSLVTLTFSIINKVLIVPVNISSPVFDSVETKTNEKIIFNGSYFTYNSSDIEINLYDKMGQLYSCPVIQGDSTFSTISCNISNFLKLKDESNIKVIIKIGIYTNQLSINLGVINSPIKMCLENQCSQNSYCLTNNGSCICNYGFTGLPDCTTIHNDCLNDCSSSIGGGKCNYLTGICNCNQYRGGEDCSEIQCQKTCFNGGVCDMTKGECKCIGNYFGDDCLSINCKNNCQNGGTCDTTKGECKCIGNHFGEDCLSTNCTNNCQNGGTCDTTIGKCRCVGNYFGDDCLSINCNNNCQNGGTCDTTIGECKCIDNYFGDDCLSINCPNSCMNGGSCDHSIGECNCPNQYQGDDCSIPFIECTDSCLNGGTCNNITGECNCLNQYQGSDCSSIKCTLDFCLNGGICDLSTYQCQCISGYQGDDCSILKCSNSCLNGGLCNETIGECKCSKGYQGKDCSTPNHWVSSINETTNLGGEVTLYGWFGDIHFDLTVTIGQLTCKDPVAIDNKTIKCQLPQGQSGIQNVNVTQNQIIWIGKDLFFYSDNENSNIKNNCLNNCNSKGVCLSSGECRCNDGWKGLDCNSPNNTVGSKDTYVDENGKTTIDDGYNNYEIFIDKLIELNFNGQQVKIYDLNKKWEKVINDTNIDKSVQLFNQKLDDNQGELVYKVEIIDQAKDYTFSGLNYRLEKDSIKISIFIYNYTYSSTLNTLQLQMVTKTEEKEIKKDKCNNKETEVESTSNQLLNFITIKKDNKVLYGRFINKVISDGRSTHLKTSIISSDKSKSTITMGMDLPHCKNCLIDPDFSLLLTTNFKDSCGDDDNRKSYIIPVAVVASFVGVAAIGASGFLVYRKKKVEVSQSKLRKLAKNK